MSSGRFVRSLVLVAIVAARGGTEVSGGITGTVYVNAMAPEPTWLPLPGAVVMVEASPSDTVTAMGKVTVTLDDEGLHPLVQSLSPGGELGLKTQSSSIHRLFAVGPTGSHLFTVALTIPGVEVTKTLRSEGLVTIRCGEPRHDHERAFVYVVPHVGSTTTDPSGRFLISGVPPGVRAILAFHPEIGSVHDSVEVVPARATRRDLYLIRLDLPPLGGFTEGE